MIRTFVAVAVAALVSLGGAEAASGLSIPLDEVRVVTFAKPVSVVYVGNPVIADVMIIDSRHAFVQGKAFGVTNVIALDGNGRQIANEQISVSGRAGGMVTLQRGAQRTTYACVGNRCQPSPQPGDAGPSFDAATEQITRYQSLLGRAASGGQQ
jgi:hypothetical protein